MLGPRFFEVGWPNGRAPVLQTGRESSILSPTTGDERPWTVGKIGPIGPIGRI